MLDQIVGASENGHANRIDTFRVAIRRRAVPGQHRPDYQRRAAPIDCRDSLIAVENLAGHIEGRRINKVLIGEGYTVVA